MTREEARIFLRSAGWRAIEATKEFQRIEEVLENTNNQLNESELVLLQEQYNAADEAAAASIRYMGEAADIVEAQCQWLIDLRKREASEISS